MELTGFEPVTPSLRKMRSQPSDQEKRHTVRILWGGRGASDVSPRETARESVRLGTEGLTQGIRWVRDVYSIQGQATPSAFAAGLSFMTRRRSLPGTASKTWCWQKLLALSLIASTTINRLPARRAASMMVAMAETSCSEPKPDLCSAPSTANSARRIAIITRGAPLGSRTWVTSLGSILV